MQVLYKHIALLGFVLFSITKSHSQSLPISSYGVWDRGGGVADYSAPNADFVKGIETSVDWKDIQAGPGTNNCDFSAFQTILDVAVANDKLIRFSVNVGPDCPLWVFDNGVPLVNVISNAPKNDAYANRNPYYPDPEYKAYYFEMIRQFALFLRNQPQVKFNHIAFVQVKTGCTGDEEPYKGDVINPIYDLSTAQWEAFRLEAFAKFKLYFNDVTTRKIVLTFNNVDPVAEPLAYNYVMTQLDPVLGFGLKGGAFNRGHHLSDEQTYKEQWNPFLINPKVGPGNPNGVKLFSASEMDQSWDKGYFALNYEIGFYWSALGGINTGLSCTNISVSAMTYALANPGIIDIFKMYNRYAQQVYPLTATTAFSVFHEGLNSADTVKFPESIYGNATKTNLTRYQNICNNPLYYNRGARIDDPIAVVRGQVFQREDQEFYNDAGWEICEGNIERFMTQINPDATSVGLFRVRGPITATSSKYDRFARSFENSTGKNTMYFQLHNEVPANNKTLKFTIIWLDKNAGSTWAFKYRNSTGLQTIPFTGIGTNQWRTETITISDAIMNQGGTLQSDFMLVNTDAIDDIFNGIEMNIFQGQTISFNALPSKKVGDADFSPGATASSGLAITYTSSDINVATIVDNNIHIVGSGACTISASQAGNSSYNAATSVAQYLAVAIETQNTITTSGTWTCPAGVTSIQVETWGGGGGGGGTYLAGFAGGGAGGSYVINNSVSVFPATSYTVTVGAGGTLTGNGGANGNNGGNTTFGSTTPIIANGGVAGNGANGAGQLGLGGTNVTGGSGGTVTLGLPGASGATGAGGAGGAGALGGAGAASRTNAANGFSATTLGGGGGGAYGAISGSNKGGAGGAGQIKITYTVGVPNVPTVGTASVSGVSGEASIPFTAPTFNGNSTITTYTATSSPGGITATLSQLGSGTILVTGLTNGTSYTFTVRATNSIGQSAESASSNAVTPFTVPNAPTIETASLTSVIGQAIISFTAPASNGGSPITTYTATSSPGGLIGTLNQAGSGVITVNGLSNGTTYTFTVRASNAAGFSADSATSNAVITDYRISQSLTFDALPEVNYGDTVLPEATASSGLPITYTSNNPLVATTSGSTISVVGVGSAIITATQSGNETYTPTTSVSQTLVVNKKPLTITTPSIVSKVYNSFPTSGLISTGILSGFVGAETVTVTATGLYADANVGTAKLATITYVLADGFNEGKAANYSLASDTAEGIVTQAPLTVVGIIANNKPEDGNTMATLSALGSLSGVFASDTANVNLNSSSVYANFDTAAVGIAKPVTISGYTIAGDASANYSLTQPTGITANIELQATITADGSTTFCSGGSVLLSANTGSGLSYLWSTGATTPSITANTQGSYTVTITSAGGESTSAPTTVTVNPIPDIPTIITAAPTCLASGSSILTNYSASNTYTFSPSGPSAGSGGVISSATLGQAYTITTTNTSTCTSGSSVSFTNLSQLASPTATITAEGATTFCASDSVTLTANTGSGLSYLWSTGATTPSIVVSTTSSPWVTVTNANSCNATSVASTVTVINSGITSQPSNTLICKIIGGSATLSVVAANPSATYQWEMQSTAAVLESTWSNVVNPATGAAIYSGMTAASLSITRSAIAIPPTGTKYRVKVTSGTCATVTSSVIAITDALLPVIPSALVLTNPAILPLTTPVTALGSYAGTNTPFKLTATPGAASDTAASSYVWTLPTGVVRTDDSGVSTDNSTTSTSTSAFIYVKFTGTGATTPLVINVQSVNASGCTSPMKASASLTRLLPTAPSAITMNDGNTTTAITSFAKYMGTSTVLRLSATAAATANSYLWELPAGVNRVTALSQGSVTTDLTSTDPFIYVNFLGVTLENTDTSVLTPLTKVLRIGVKSVNGVGNSVTLNSALVNPITSSTAKLLTLSAVAPAAPTALALNNGSNLTAITVISKFIGQGGVYRLSATVPATTLANRFEWELPTFVTRVTDMIGETPNYTNTSINPEIFVKFSGTAPSTTSIYFGVKALNNVGSSVTNNSAATVIPATSSTAKLLKLSTVVPAAPIALALNNGSNLTPITVISKFIGQGGTYRLSATVPSTTLANSFTWELPACVARVTSMTNSTLVENLDSSAAEIFVKFTTGTSALPGSVYFGVKAVNSVGSSVTNNSAATFIPATSSTAKLLKLSTVVPAAPTTLVLNDINNSPSTTAVVALGKYINKTTKLKLITGVSALANTYSWTLPEGVNRVDENGDAVTGLTSTEPFIYVNFAGINPINSNSISIVLGVNAVNSVGASVTINTNANSTRTDKLLTATAGLPAVVATVSPNTPLTVCNRLTGFIYTITAPLGANYYEITAPMGSVVNSASSPSNTSNVLTTSDLTFNVVYAAFTSLNNKLVIKSGNAFGLFGMAKSMTMVYSNTCQFGRSISDTLVEDDFSVVAYPNPSTEGFKVISSNEKSFGVQVYDIAGRLIEQRQMNSDDQIGSNYASGIYNVIVTQDANVETLRVIKN